MQDEPTRDEREKARYRQTSQVSLQDYVRVILVRKWLVLTIFLVSLSPTVYYLRTTSPVYESQMLLMRETASERLPADIIGLSLAAEKWDPGQELLLKSISLLVEAKQQLRERYNFDVTLERLEKGISLSMYKQSSTMLKLTADANTPEQAQATADIIADIYIKKITDMKKTELAQGMRFLEQQMRQFEEKVREAEKALGDFRDREGLIYATSITSTSTTASSGLIGKLGELQDELSRTESDVELAKSQLQSVEELISEKKKYAQSSSVAEMSPQISQLQERLIGLQVELSTKLEALTEKDPEVIAVQRKIDVIQKQLKEEFGKLLAGPGVASFDPISELQSLMQQYITLKVQLNGLERKAALANEKVDKFRAEHPELVSKQIELVRLERQARVNEQTLAILTSKYEDMRLLEQMKASGLKVIDAASLPKSPTEPKIKQTLALGVLLGLFLAVAAAFFMEYLDDSVKGKEDVEGFLELPVAGMLPKMEPFDISEDVLSRQESYALANKGRDGSLSDANASGPPVSTVGGSEVKVRRRSRHRRGYRERTKQLLSHSLLYAPAGVHKKNPAIEGYRNLAVNIRYLGVDNSIKSILVTSSLPGEGKTITASNLAVVMAQGDKKVLLVDADLRRPKLHTIFQVDRNPGLTNLLMGETDSTDGVIRPTVMGNLFLLPSGVRVPNPGTLFQAGAISNLVESLGKQFDLIIFDSPPLLSVADPVALATEVDGTLMVIYTGGTKLEICLQGKEALEGVNARIIGAVLNNIDYAKQYGSYYYYYYYYRSYYYYSSDDGDDEE